MGAELDARDALVQVLVRPGGKAGVDGLLELEEALGDAARRGDRHDHHHARLEHEHLDVADRRRLEARRRDEREQAGDLREHLRRRLQCGLDLAAHRGQVERKTRGPRFHGLEYLRRVEPVTGFGRDPPRRRVRMRQEPQRLELGQLVPDGRGGEGQPRARDERLRADGLAGRDVLGDDAAENLALPFGQLGHLQGF